jgi:hypothetical protein
MMLDCSVCSIPCATHLHRTEHVLTTQCIYWLAIRGENIERSAQSIKEEMNIKSNVRV